MLNNKIKQEDIITAEELKEFTNSLTCKKLCAFLENAISITDTIILNNLIHNWIKEENNPVLKVLLARREGLFTILRLFKESAVKEIEDLKNLEGLQLFNNQ